MNLKSLSDSELVAALSRLVIVERKLTVDVVEHIREMDERRLYLNLGCTSLFQYLTEKLGYTPGSAQRRIDSARMVRELPEIKESLQNGELNLMQVSHLARSVREKQKKSQETVSSGQKREILSAIKKQDLMASEQTICQMLDIEPKSREIKKAQKDESVRIETSFTKEQYALLQEVKDAISHVHPNPSVAEVFEHLARRFLKKDVPVAKKSSVTAKVAAAETSEAASESASEPVSDPVSRIVSQRRPYIPRPVRRAVFEKQKCCQWRDKKSDQTCGSKFQLEVDHIQPVWAGGDSSLGNLQLLCDVHNRLKYEQESGVRR